MTALADMHQNLAFATVPPVPLDAGVRSSGFSRLCSSSARRAQYPLFSVIRAVRALGETNPGQWRVGQGERVQCEILDRAGSSAR